MSVKRGDVILLDYSFVTGGGSKGRPAVVVQNHRDNQRLSKTIVVPNTRVTRRAFEVTQVLIDIATPEGQLTGLRMDSVVNCANVLTLDQSKVLRTLGTFSASFMEKVDVGLKTAFDLRT